VFELVKRQLIFMISFVFLFEISIFCVFELVKRQLIFVISFVFICGFMFVSMMCVNIKEESKKLTNKNKMTSQQQTNTIHTISKRF